MDFLKNWFTEADNATFCIVRALGGTAGVAMIYKFSATPATGFQDFAVGIAAICAAVALKNASEK